MDIAVTFEKDDDDRTAMRAVVGAWTFEWYGRPGLGATYLEVGHLEGTHPLDCVHMGDTVKHVRPWTQRKFRAAVRMWMRDNSAAWSRELPYELARQK